MNTAHKISGKVHTMLWSRVAIHAAAFRVSGTIGHISNTIGFNSQIYRVQASVLQSHLVKHLV